MRFVDVERLLKANGWYVYRVKGTYYHYKHLDKSGKVTVHFIAETYRSKPFMRFLGKPK